MNANRAAVEFAGSQRFVLEGRLGEGGMGVVYRAHDRESSLPVALKTMAYVEPSALLRFKNEFRALADISHPNVVQLYEMVSEGEHWFFTMELLDGVDFLRWVHHEEQLSLEDSQSMLVPWVQERRVAFDAASPTIDAPRGPAPPMPQASGRSHSAPLRTCDIERLRAALLQLAQGVNAIHAAGKLHRDIKPSNVQVTSDGRVVLLDFGVVGDLADVSDRPHFDDPILGTPAYMAPEQARGVPAGMAGDWYAVGVILYEALTARLPFEGTPRELLFNKQGAGAEPPSAWLAGIPPDLDALCMDLLHRDPKQRPAGEEVLRRLAPHEASARSWSRNPSLTPGSLRAFVGRDQQLARLDECFDASAAGGVVVALLSGRSGMGKTALAQRFSHASKRRGAIVLSGRCFEREALPFKGMDSVVDELSRYLTSQAPRDLVGTLPAGLHYLLRVFPVLRAVPAFRTLPVPELELVEPSEIRKRAFAALKELLFMLRAGSPLVIHIDDLQWSDIDSLVLLEELLRSPQAPALLLICGFREETRLTSPILDELRALLARLGSQIAVHELTVEPLSMDEAVELARMSLETTEGNASPTLARAIALESRGVPIFVSELSAWQVERRERGEAEQAQPLGVSLEQVIGRRIAELPSEAGRLLDVLSVANGPLPYAVAEQAARVPRNDALRARLRVTRLVRTSRVQNQEFVEAYHARVRDSVLAHLGAEQRRGWHASLARALATTNVADPEALVEQYLAAGEPENARQYVLPAARAAEAGLAFLRAARLYRLAIEIGAEGDRYQLLTRVGNALVDAGRSAEAADAYHEAARAAPDERAIELSRLAAEHYLKGGRDLDGLAELRSVLSRVGMNYPQSSAAAVSSLLYHRARVRLRGLAFAQVSAARCAPRDLMRVDVAFSATAGLAMIDVVRGADFGAQQLQLALNLGEPLRICRALAFEASNAAAVGAGSRARIDRLLRTAEELAWGSEDPHGTALAKVAAGLVRVFSGEWRAARHLLDEAELILRERCRAVTWELTNARAWSQNSLILCGDLPAAASRMPALLREASERSDRYASMHLIYPACITALAAGDAHAGLRVATDDTSFRSCEPGRFTAGHWGRLISTQSVHRYQGEGKRARAFVESEWPALVSSQFLRVHLMRVFSEFERALSAIAALDEGETSRSVAREAERSVKRVAQDGPPYAAPMGRFLAGCLAAARGETERARLAFERAARGLAAVDMGYLALCARRRSADLRGGDEGRALSAQCARDFTQLGVADVEACLRMSAPGFRRLSA